jgi:hypothetical protein
MRRPAGARRCVEASRAAASPSSHCCPRAPTAVPEPPLLSPLLSYMGFPVVFVTAFTGVAILRPVSLWIPLKRTMCLMPLSSAAPTCTVPSGILAS